jgi:hypothetical protein
LSGPARRRQIVLAAQRRWRRAEHSEGRRGAEIAFSATIGALAVLLTLVVVAASLPGAAAVAGSAIGLLPLTGVLAGYACWRWARWVRDRSDRLHWSVLATAGAAVTVAELYGTAAIVASQSGFLERIAAFGGLGLITAATVAVTGAMTLISYHRSVTDAHLTQAAHRFS